MAIILISKLSGLGTPFVQKHFTHCIDEEAVKIFKCALPSEHWTVYDIRPDYGKDHKVELVEGGEHTGQSFWVQIKGQRKIRTLKNGTISFRLETKDLDYHTKLQAPVFLIVVDITNQVGYWVFTQEYERTRLSNVAWRCQEYIQIHLPVANRLTSLNSLRHAVTHAIRYMTRLTFHTDLGAERRSLEAIDPRFKVKITVGDSGRHYHFHSDEVIPFNVSYRDGAHVSGKIEDMLERGHPIVVTGREIVVSGSPLFDYFFETAGESDVRLECNKTFQGYANFVRADRMGNGKARIDAMPCSISCGMKEARIEAHLPPGLLVLQTTVPLGQPVTRPMSVKLDLSTWNRMHLMQLPYFEQLAGLFVDLELGEKFIFECFAPGQRLFRGTLNIEADHPHRDISFLIEILRKARAIAGLHSANPILPEDYQSGQSLAEIQMLYEMILGDGYKRTTPSANYQVTVRRRRLEHFLTKVNDFGSLGTLNLRGNGSFPFLGESIIVDSLDRIVTNVRLLSTPKTLKSQLKRFPSKKSFNLEWEAAEATETIFRKLTVDDAGSTSEVSREEG